MENLIRCSGRPGGACRQYYAKGPRFHIQTFKPRLPEFIVVRTLNIVLPPRATTSTALMGRRDLCFLDRYWLLLLVRIKFGFRPFVREQPPPRQSYVGGHSFPPWGYLVRYRLILALWQLCGS